ncbi:hypothetical protein [Chitinophaga sp. YIM B06452]|uniref:hypothetical protein n=1 Tax=Chitinophaga sp. YIM B06452 TaxID=3082158 RepID=UPI0031FE6D0E
MKLSDQVCTPQQAKRLKEYGVTQDSQYYYTAEGLFPKPFVNFTLESYSAFTVAELGVMLGEGSFSYRPTSSGSKSSKWAWRNEQGESESPFDTEAQARAAKLLWDIGAYNITAEEANKRLKA